MKSNCRGEIRAALASDDPLGAVTQVVRRLKDQGCGQREVYDLLEQIRQEVRAEGRDSEETALIVF